MGELPRFGPAGNEDRFFEEGNRGVMAAPAYVRGLGLDAYEYQGGHGIHISDERASRLGALARENGVALSVHAPYFISMSSTEEEKRQNSVGYILQSARAARAMGARRVVVHTGSCGKLPRAQALELARETFRSALAALDAEGLSDIRLCPETMGKVGQLGTVEEVVELCGLDERLIPCLDFGHIYARSFGSLIKPAEFRAVFDAVENGLGTERMRRFHSHFSHIEYTEKGGEKRHLTFADTAFGPAFEPVAELCVQKGCAPVFICESAGTQAHDACAMREIYRRAERAREQE